MSGNRDTRSAYNRNARGYRIIGTHNGVATSFDANSVVPHAIALHKGDDTMNRRDRDYIEDRLLDPCPKALEAYGRLIQTNQHVLARELMEAMQEFTDKCREIRHKLREVR